MNKKILTLLITSIILINLASALIIESVDINPSQVEPGKSVSVSVSLENNENKDLTDINVKIDLKDLPFSGTNELTLDIDEDDSEEAEFNLEVLDNAKSGVYTIPIQVNYINDESKATTKTSSGVVKVSSIPKIDVVREDGLLLKGQKNILTLKIINKGLADIKFSEIEVIPSGIDILSQKKVYLGDIDSDDFDTAEFQVFIKENSPNNIILPVNVVYKDVLNKEYRESFNVELRVYSREDAYSLGLLTRSYTNQIVIGVIVLLVLWFIYRRIRKRLRKRRAEREAREV